MATYVGHDWKQCAVIIFIFCTKRNLELTCTSAGVKELTLSGWLSQKIMEMWLDLVEYMNEERLIKSLLFRIQDLFVDGYLESTGSEQRHRW
jgi:hypothetical protein